MADLIGATDAMASAARGNMRLDECGGGGVNTAFAKFVADSLSPAMRSALGMRQSDMFGRDLLAGGYPITLKALERRGLIEGRNSRITELGEIVAEIASDQTPGAPKPEPTIAPEGERNP
jgi:hypothetical protein